MMINEPYRDFSTAQLALMQAAESLFASNSIGAVSDREIARLAGQKNNSAVQYHFSSRDGLIQALLDYRLLAIDAIRQHELDLLASEGKQVAWCELFGVMVVPMRMLHIQVPQSLRALDQLFSLYNESFLYRNQSRISSMPHIADLLHQQIPRVAMTQLEQQVLLVNRLLFAVFANLAESGTDTTENSEAQTILIFEDKLEVVKRVFCGFSGESVNAAVIDKTNS